MKKVQKMFRKAVSMIIAVCLMVGIANIPVYAGISATVPVKTTNAVLGKTYYTPAQAVKKATATKKPTAKKTTAKKATATKKPAAKAVSLTSQIISKYTKKGLTALKAVANKLGFSLKTTYKQFVRYGVKKTDMKKVSNTLIKLVNRGVIFANCASLAVSKYLGINRNFAALQNLAADIAKYVEGFVKDYSNETKIIGSGSMNIVLQKNGHKEAQNYEISLKSFMNNLKKGENVILTTACYNRNGQHISSHAITIRKEKNGKYGVFDTLLNGGEEVIYTEAEFKKFMNGKSAKGKTSSGRSITKPVYYTNTTSGVIRYKPIESGKISVLTDSKSISMVYFKTTEAYKYMQKAISVADKLLNKKGISGLAKTWLKKFKTLINDCIKSSKSYLDKFLFAYNVHRTIQKIAEEKASILSLAKYSSYSGKNFIYHVVYPLRTVLKNNITYKIYTKYGEAGVNLIEDFSKDYKLKETDVYNIFVKNKVTKTQIEDQVNHLRSIMYRMVNGFDVFNDSLVASNENIKKALTEIKKLLNK